MASLEQDPKTKRYRLRFRFGGRSCKRSLGTANKREAIAAQVRFEETLGLVQSGRLPIPPDTDPIAFLISEGRATSTKTLRLVTLGQLLDSYQQDLPPGAKEDSTLYTEAIHLRHLKRLLKVRQSAVSLSHNDLQHYVNKRLRENRHGKPIRSDTIKKELATLRVAWNWAIDHDLIEKAFPSRGLSFPKRSEKLPFMTWDEITRTLRRGGLDPGEENELWESLFLRREEVDELIGHLTANSPQRFVLPMILMAAHTGARRSEIVRSRLDDFDFHTGLVRLREKKRSRKRSVTFRYVPMTDELQRTMNEWHETRRHGQETFALDDGAALKLDTARYWFNKVLKGSKWSKLRGFHVLRHSFASNLAAGGVDQRIIDEWMGHQTDEMRRRYRHLFPDQQREALQSVFGRASDDSQSEPLRVIA
ncbi:MAG: site-specific integrase [Planctomycetota bacterium]